MLLIFFHINAQRLDERLQKTFKSKTNLENYYQTHFSFLEQPLRLMLVAKLLHFYCLANAESMLFYRAKPKSGENMKNLASLTLIATSFITSILV